MGVGAGTANISYELTSGCKAVTTVTVNPAVATVLGPSSVCAGSNISLVNTMTGGWWSSSNTAIATVDSASGIVAGVTPGIAAITYMLSNGCNTVKVLTVKQLPATIAGKDSVCTDGNVILTSPNTGGGMWTSSNVTVATIGSNSGLVTGITPGTATITYISYTGCMTTRDVTVDLAPVVAPIIGALSNVTVDHSIVLGDATFGGVWSSSKPSKAIVNFGGMVTGMSSGATVISYTVTNGVCQVAATRLVLVTTSRDGNLSQASSVAAFKLYPNPSHGTLTIESPVGGILTLFTLEGKQLQAYNILEGSNQLQLPLGLPAGAYICKYHGEDGSDETVRLVNEH
jgi:uncharacterized protein YjdB